MKKSLLALTAIFMVLVYSPSAMAAYDWYVEIKQQSSPYKSSIRGGTADDATSGYDAIYETDAYFFGQLRTYFYEPTWNDGSSGSTGYFWSDIRSSTLPQTWDFEVKNYALDKDVTISWDLKSLNKFNKDICDGIVELALTDKATGQTVGMLSGKSHTYFSTSSNPYEFSVNAKYSTVPEVVSSPSNISAKVQDNGVSLSWSNVLGLSGYNVFKSTDNGSTFKAVNGNKLVTSKKDKSNKKVTFLDRSEAGTSDTLIYSVVGVSVNGCTGSGATVTVN